MLKNLFKKKKNEKGENLGMGFFLFQEAGQAIRAEKTLKNSGYEVRLMAPPPDYRTGCDLVVVFDIIEQTVLSRLLEQSDNPPLKILPISDETMTPLTICKTKDFGNYLMVRAANMKITVDKRNLQIVNISGGGCPDVPYLANCMIGKKLNEKVAPSKIGFTLCAYTLNVAYLEAVRLLQYAPKI